MGYLNFDDGDESHLPVIRQPLKRRGLVMDKTDDWEIHGPHRDMNYVVYVGKAYESLDHTLECCCDKAIMKCVKHKKGFYVAIYPRAVYDICDSSDWWKPKREDRIPVKKET
jgi:hypothetical protein